MNITPFSGLLTIIHIAVVLSCKVYYLFLPQKVDYIARKRRPLLSMYISGLVILFVFLFSSIGAVLAVHASLEDKNSSVRLVRELIVKVDASTFVASMGQLKKKIISPDSGYLVDTSVWVGDRIQTNTRQIENSMI